MLYILINPSSHRRRSRQIWRQIEKELKNEKIPYQCIVSRNHEDIDHAAASLSSDGSEKTVVILGGDGTLNEFLNGLTDTSHIRIGYIPIGSGNDFARGMGITMNYKEELDLILHDKQTRQIHYGIVSYSSGREKKFFVSAGIGYDARVCYEVDHSRLKSLLGMLGLGRLVYLFIGVQHLLRARTYTASLSVDGETALEGEGFLFASFHMLPYEGGGFKFCPDQRPEEDMLHICVAKGIAKKKIPFIIPQALLGTHIYREGVYQYRCSEARIQASQPEYVHTDGETDHQYTSIRLSVSPDCITFLN